MKIGDTEILDTFAEAFPMKYSRLLVTAFDEHWLWAAAREMTGYSSSVIACDMEAGIECALTAEQTLDGRNGLSILCFGFSTDALAKALTQRVGQCIMTCPTTAVFDGIPARQQRIPLGKRIRYFGDGYQKSKQIGGERLWRIPVMDGEFLVAEDLGCDTGVAGGNFILQAVDQQHALAAARRAVAAIEQQAGVITPFPGGVARSGSKVGSRYKALKASTSEAYCPTLRGRVDSQVVADANCVLEVVIDGVDQPSVGLAMRMGIEACAGEGVLAIGAGNYGGKLGEHHFHLHRLLSPGTQG